MARGPQETPRPTPAPLPATAAPSREPSAETVAEYLLCHPEFFAARPELLDHLQVPAASLQGGGRVLDLRAALIERLRAEVGRMTLLRDEMVSAGRSNQQAQSRVHEAVLALLGATSFEQLIERATGDLAVILDLDVVALGVEQRAEDLPPVRLGGVFQLEPGTVDRLIGSGRELKLRAAVPGDPLLYGAGAGLVRSDALVRLVVSPATPPALLALGSRQEGHFHAGQGTALLGFLGAVLARCVRAWLDLPD